LYSIDSAELHVTDYVVIGTIEQGKFISGRKEYSNGILEEAEEFIGGLLEPKIFNGEVYSATPNTPFLRLVEGKLLLQDMIQAHAEHLTNIGEPTKDPRCDHFTEQLILNYPQDLQQYYYNYYKENN
jgi:hypothetical protein